MSEANLFRPSPYLGEKLTIWTGGGVDIVLAGRWVLLAIKRTGGPGRWC